VGDPLGNSFRRLHSYSIR